MSAAFFTHILDHPQVRAIARELELFPELRPIESDWRVGLELMRKDAEQSHQEAAMIMHGYQMSRRPFGLYLRSFEQEAALYYSSDVKPDQDGGTVTTTASGPSACERNLAQALAGKLPLLAIANPAQLMTHQADIPRLQVPGGSWQAIARNLIEHAHLIVMDCDSIAPGVIWELEALLDSGRADSTILVLPPTGAREAGLGEVAAILGAVVHPKSAIGKDDPRLAAFTKVAYLDEIDFDQIESSPLFADLLTHASQLNASAEDFDPAIYARGLHNMAVHQANNREFAEAIHNYSQALLVRRHLQDKPAILLTLRSLGAAYTDCEQYSIALDCFDEALKLARELDNVGEAGIVAAYIGFSHKQLGHREEALKWLRAGYAMQTAANEHEELESTLIQLAALHRDACETAETLGCYTLLQDHARQTNDQPAQLRATLLLAGTHWSANQPTQAAQHFQQALHLAQQTNDTEREQLCLAALQKLGPT